MSTYFKIYSKSGAKLQAWGQCVKVQRLCWSSMSRSSIKFTMNSEIHKAWRKLMERFRPYAALEANFCVVSLQSSCRHNDEVPYVRTSYRHFTSSRTKEASALTEFHRWVEEVAADFRHLNAFYLISTVLKKSIASVPIIKTNIRKTRVVCNFLQDKVLFKYLERLSKRGSKISSWLSSPRVFCWNEAAHSYWFLLIESAFPE